MKVKVSDLIGPALDWAVAQVKLGVNARYVSIVGKGKKAEIWLSDPGGNITHLSYSSSWSQGGPIIERKQIDLIYDVIWIYDKSDPDDNGERWFAAPCGGDINGYYGLTPLIAAMRCYVGLELGDEVEIPDELAKDLTR